LPLPAPARTRIRPRSARTAFSCAGFNIGAAGGSLRGYRPFWQSSLVRGFAGDDLELELGGQEGAGRSERLSHEALESISLRGVAVALRGGDAEADPGGLPGVDAKELPDEAISPVRHPEKVGALEEPIRFL
jgi:hypothetical protein